MSISGKWALVTGGAVRIGRAICYALAEQGCNVIVHYNRSSLEAGRLVAELRERGVNSDSVAGDLAGTDSCGRIIEEAWRISQGELYGLVNNASVFERSVLLDCDEEIMMRQLRPNFIAPFTLMLDFARRHARHAASSGSAGVVNLLDRRIAGSVCGQTPYLLSKKMLAELTLLAAKELGPAVRVNGVAPGAALPPVTVTGAEGTRVRPDCTVQEVAAAVVDLLRSDRETGRIVFVGGEAREDS